MNNIVELIYNKLKTSNLQYKQERFKGDDGKYHFLYVSINKLNNRFYIGIHSSINKNDYYRGSGKAIKQAYKCYGIENFEFIRLCYFNNRSDLSKAEGFVVDQQFLQEQEGVLYNLKTGGDYEFFDPKQGQRCKDHWNSNDWVGQRMRDGMKKIRENHEKFINSPKGLELRKHSSEHMKELWSDPEWRANMEKKKEESRKRHMEQYPTFLKENSDKARLINIKCVIRSKDQDFKEYEEFESLVEASKVLNLSQDGIKIAVFQNGKKLYKGYYWKYKNPEDYIEKLSDKEQKKLEQRQKETIEKLNQPIEWNQQLDKSKPVGISYEYNGPIVKVIDSGATAMKLLGYKTYTSLPTGLAGSYQRRFGFYWRYLTDEEIKTN